LAASGGHKGTFDYQHGNCVKGFTARPVTGLFFKVTAGTAEQLPFRLSDRDVVVLWW
jgi:hypothetical protein